MSRAHAKRASRRRPEYADLQEMPSQQPDADRACGTAVPLREVRPAPGSDGPAAATGRRALRPGGRSGAFGRLAGRAGVAAERGIECGAALCTRPSSATAAATGCSLVLPARSGKPRHCASIPRLGARWWRARRIHGGSSSSGFRSFGNSQGVRVNGNRKLHTFDNRKSDTPDLRSYPQTRCWGCLARCSCG